jgi:hypothetical protein
MENSEDIYFHQPLKPTVDTSTIFEIATEGKKLRVKNQHVNCLFSNLTAATFDACYNDYVQHLNMNFAPVYINGKLYQLKPIEQEYLMQKIITSWIYYYTINNLPVEVKRADFTHPYMVDYVLGLLDGKFGKDTEVSLAVGASILRQDLEEYNSNVAGRRRYYDR